MPDLASARIKVGSELEVAGPSLNAQAETIMGDLHRLKTSLASLIDAWQAQSATAYQECMHEWDLAAVGLFGSAEEGGILGEIANVLKVAWVNSVSTEEANLATWKSSA
ncbi:WXG100 family type VII secretion target [Streptacidiphilus griseoplanus]|uniref:WXG100 family type VII secretion target n=1 Tax=Peterkaempfera griseoplana TaxID=66896 RepID=UPI0006E3AEBD|nr:WXG100 family type VII secretion target [Peterkaempfera griseoplana]